MRYLKPGAQTSENIVTEQGMVVTPQPEATEAGKDLLAAGGNAIDAAIGAALVQAVIDPTLWSGGNRNFY